MTRLFSQPSSFLVLVFTLIACSTGLKEYDVGTVIEDFHEDISAGELAALSVCGFACHTPGFPSLWHAYCYRDRVSIRTIDPTADFVRGDSHFRLKQKAREYAEAYNMLLLKHVEELGVSQCPSQENWDSAHNDLDSLVRASGDIRASAGAPLSLEGSFMVVAIEPYDWKSLPEDACRIFAENGIKREVVVEGTIVGADDESKQKFVCGGSNTEPYRLVD